MDATYEMLQRFFPAIAGWPWWVVFLLVTLLPALACFTFMGLGPIIYVYAERIAPNSAYLLFEAQPAMISPTVDRLAIAVT